MKWKLFWILIFAALMMICFSFVCYVFETKFAELTIDYFAFFAGIFLVIEATWKIFSSKDKFFPNQLFRLMRAVIGINIFTIHLLQFMRF